MGPCASVSILCLIWQITYPAEGLKWPITNLSSVSKLPMISLIDLTFPQSGNNIKPEKETANGNDKIIDGVTASSNNFKQLSTTRDESQNNIKNINIKYDACKEDAVQQNLDHPFIVKQDKKNAGTTNNRPSYLSSPLESENTLNVIQKVDLNKIQEAEPVAKQGILESGIKKENSDLEDKTNKILKQENTLNTLYDVYFEGDSENHITNLIRSKNSINNFLPQINYEKSLLNKVENNLNNQNNYYNLYNLQSLPYTYVTNPNVEPNLFISNDNVNNPLVKENILKYFNDFKSQGNRRVGGANNISPNNFIKTVNSRPLAPPERPDFTPSNKGNTELFVLENNINDATSPQSQQTFNFKNQQIPFLNNVNNINTGNTKLPSENNFINFNNINNAPCYRNPADFYPANLNFNSPVSNSDVTFNYKPGFKEIQNNCKNLIEGSLFDISKVENTFPKSLNTVGSFISPYKIPDSLPSPNLVLSIKQLPSTESPSKPSVDFNPNSSLRLSKMCFGLPNTELRNNFEQISVKPELFASMKPISSSPYSSGFEVSSLLNPFNNNPTYRPENTLSSDIQIQKDFVKNKCANGQPLTQGTVISSSPYIENNAYCKNPVTNVDISNSLNAINSLTTSNTNFNNIVYPLNRPSPITTPFTGPIDNLYKIANDFIPNVNLPQIIPQNCKQDNIIPYPQCDLNNDFAPSVFYHNPQTIKNNPQFQRQTSSNEIQLQNPVNFMNQGTTFYQKPVLPPVNLFSQNINNSPSAYQSSKCDDSKQPPVQYTSSNELNKVLVNTYFDGINRQYLTQNLPDCYPYKGLPTSPIPFSDSILSYPNIAPISKLPNVLPPRNPIRPQPTQPTITYANLVTKNPYASQIEKILSPSGIVGSITEAANIVAKNALSAVISNKLSKKSQPASLPPVNPFIPNSFQTCSTINEPSYSRDIIYQPIQSRPKSSQLYNGFEVPDFLSRLSNDISSIPNIVLNYSDAPDLECKIESSLAQAIPYLNSVTVNVVPVMEDFGYEFKNTPKVPRLNFELPSVPRVPRPPNVLNFELPSVSCLPNIPNLLNYDLPTVSLLPNLNFELPSISYLPTPNINVPQLLDIPSVSFVSNPFNTFNYEFPTITPSYLPTPNINLTPIPQIIDVPAIMANMQGKDTNELNRLLELLVLSELMNANEFRDKDALDAAVALMLLS